MSVVERHVCAHVIVGMRQLPQLIWIMILCHLPVTCQSFIR